MTVCEKGLEAAEAELMRVLGDQRYVMPADGMAQVLTAYEAAKTAGVPVAWLKEWTTDDGFAYRRVDLSEGNEAWLAFLKPTVTPLYAAPPPPQVPHE